jgi:reactive intermediate/imine deaminase
LRKVDKWGDAFEELERFLDQSRKSGEQSKLREKPQVEISAEEGSVESIVPPIKPRAEGQKWAAGPRFGPSISAPESSATVAAAEAAAPLPSTSSTTTQMEATSSISIGQVTTVTSEATTQAEPISTIPHTEPEPQLETSNATDTATIPLTPETYRSPTDSWKTAPRFGPGAAPIPAPPKPVKDPRIPDTAALLRARQAPNQSWTSGPWFTAATAAKQEAEKTERESRKPWYPVRQIPAAGKVWAGAGPRFGDAVAAKMGELAGEVPGQKRALHTSRDQTTKPKAASGRSRGTAIHTPDAMSPVGPYSQAVLTPPSAPLIFVSGQLPATPDGLLVHGTMAAKTAACINALAAILEAGGSSLDQIVKTTVFLTDLEDFGEMNEVYGEMIGHKPARSCVQVAKLPKGVDIEIECVATVN